VCSALALVLEQPTLAQVTACWWPLAFGGLVSVGFAYTLQISLQRHFDPTLSALIFSLESVFAVLFGWLLLDERLTAVALSGCALMLLGCVLSQLPTRRSVR
jgi:drug/metabolite transporter (DMT)-like permease